MTSPSYSDRDLENFLDEALPVEEMTELEDAVRNNAALTKRLSQINARRDAGVHSVGAIWRRHRLSCPDRDQLGNYLLGILDADARDYVEFHISQAACRPCQANLEDRSSWVRRN